MDNMLASTTVPSGSSRGIAGTHTYEYDTLGRRVAKVVNDTAASTSTRAIFVCATQPIQHSPYAGQVMAEYESVNGAGATLARKYAYGSYIDEPLVLIDRTALGSRPVDTDELVHYHQNSLYCVAALVDSGSAVVERYAYSPYGQSLTLAPDATGVRVCSSFDNAYTLTGRRYDRESTSYYFRARYKFQRFGRFVSRDPLYDHGYLGPRRDHRARPLRGAEPYAKRSSAMPWRFPRGEATGTFDKNRMNTYAYTASNPLTFADPTGLDRQTMMGGPLFMHMWIIVDVWDDQCCKVIGRRELHLSPFGYEVLGPAEDGLGNVVLGPDGEPQLPTWPSIMVCTYKSTCKQDQMLLQLWPVLEQMSHEEENEWLSYWGPYPPLGFGWNCWGATIYFGDYGGDCGNAVQTGLPDLSNRYFLPCKCFAAGTPVLCPNGRAQSNPSE